jgi:hypothetical protein
LRLYIIECICWNNKKFLVVWRIVGISIIDVPSLCGASHLFETYSWRSEYAINWFHWNIFSRNFLITKGDFDWERKDYNFENIYHIYLTTGKSENHLAYTQYPWNFKLFQWFSSNSVDWKVIIQGLSGK